MTVAVAIKINNGVVLATDSATAIGEMNEESARIHYTYYNADKLFNLKKGKSLGCLTWGDGSINNVSISTLTKDFRSNLEIDTINVKEITNQFISFLKDFIGESSDVNVGFLIVGYSESEDYNPEMYCIEIKEGVVGEINDLSNENFSISWFGEYDLLSRFIFGIDSSIETFLIGEGFDDEDVVEMVKLSKENFSLPLGVPDMPIQDAIDLADFLVDICKTASKFIPGPQVIGGPTDIAVITKHEGFRWIKRKHYYSQELNILND